MKKISRLLFAFSLMFVLFAFAGCKSDRTELSKDSQQELIGAGATFPYPLYSELFKIYYLQTGVKVNYQAIGSGGGIKQLISKTVDFGGTDAFMSREKIEQSGGNIIHIPTCIGAVAVSYNLENAVDIKLVGYVISALFLGEITRWNDAKLKKLNPQMNLPDKEITVIHRSDVSGKTFIFSDYLSKVCEEWKNIVGHGKALSWPVGLGGKGNPGVAGLIKQVPGSIGYVELIYSLQNDLPTALIKNKSGNFIKPSPASASLAAEISIPDHTRVSITDTAASLGYPLSSFTWLILFEEQAYNNRERKTAEGLLRLLDWVINDGQRYPEKYDYAPLPQPAVEKASALLKTVKYEGRPLFEK